MITDYLDRFLVGGQPAQLDENIRVARYRQGAVVIPQGKDFPALTVFARESLDGESLPLATYQNHSSETLAPIGGTVQSFVLKRGYTATLAENADGTGASRNYVAQDHDIVIKSLPEGLAEQVCFIRIFPWHWTSKKGIAGNITQKLNLGWYYNWNLDQNSTPDLEYVAIRQSDYWPGLNQDWQKRGINHLLGYNEPDKGDQANMSVERAIEIWPELLKTGLRVGSPAPSDGGLDWLYRFMERADEEDLRVDFVVVHYYRSVPPGDARGAAARFHKFLEKIHERVERPLWITEWNNGANWTKDDDPTEEEQADAIEAMIEMLDETEFVERYALYNWVEPSRELVKENGNLSPAGEIYRNQNSPIFYTQPRQQK
jgi:hypothetical protein